MKYLVDTSIWINHFRKRDAFLQQLLEFNQVVIHTQIIRELALGHIPNRQKTLRDLRLLPQAQEVGLEDLLIFADNYRLWGSGLGSVDTELLASARLDSLEMLTADKTLARAWKHLNA